MKTYIGIDLGTTNSAIFSYNGEDLKLYKSPEQHDVTPTAIYLDKRGRYYGARAYKMAAFSPKNCATLFKRMMGTSTPVKIQALDLVMKPEECSAEILKVLFGYLPQEIRENPDIGTVITVPAAFNQMQKDATMAAANMAGLGRVALMQEPVAAVMSAMKAHKAKDGVFLIFDLGGGTLDVAIAESISGKVSLLEHGGIAMCGGRDFDRLLVANVVKPWLLENFALPENFSSDENYSSLTRLADYSAELAKIELSFKEETQIFMGENEIRMKDLDGHDIFLDVKISRSTLDSLIEPKLMEAIEATREILERAQLTPNDVERIVFVGGPTQYPPLREKISFQLGIPGSTEVNPMTAVAEGAALFAESIDWDSKGKGRKKSRGNLGLGGSFGLEFSYISRTPDVKTKIAVKTQQKLVDGMQIQIDSLDTGWSSGRINLQIGLIIEVSLPKMGENSFKVFLFDQNGHPIRLEQNQLNVTRTTATIDAIPASHSIGISVLDKIGSKKEVLVYLLRQGEHLPKSGQERFKAGVSIRANSQDQLLFSLWEGEIDLPITDNRPIGTYKIKGSDFAEGVITPGSDLICDYEISDSGNISLSVTVPSVGGIFSPNHNFYSRQEGQIDFSEATKQVIADSQGVISRIEEIEHRIPSEKLSLAREKLRQANDLDPNETDPEKCKQAMDNILEAKKLLNKTRKENLKEIRQIELDGAIELFEKYAKGAAKPTEVTSFENLSRSAQRSIERNSDDFEIFSDEMQGLISQLLWRQDWFLVDSFKRWCKQEYLFTDKSKMQELARLGNLAIANGDLTELKSVLIEMQRIRIYMGNDCDILNSNILRG